MGSNVAFHAGAADANSSRKQVKITCSCEAVAASRFRCKRGERAGRLGSRSSCNSEAGGGRDFAKHYKNSVLSNPDTSKIVVWRSATLRK